jgi:hypothetical protein
VRSREQSPQRETAKRRFLEKLEENGLAHFLKQLLD